VAARSSIFDLGPRARVVFVAIWLAAQIALVATASLRPEHAFAFRMFSESTTDVLHLQRRTFDGDLVSCDGGKWWTRTKNGARLYHSMRDYIDAPELSFYDIRMPASYGRAAELARLKAALDYVIGRLGDDDVTTAQFVVDVELRSGAGAQSHVTIESRKRKLDER
jgi:hypothetical protein